MSIPKQTHTSSAKQNQPVYGSAWIIVVNSDISHISATSPGILLGNWRVTIGKNHSLIPIARQGDPWIWSRFIGRNDTLLIGQQIILLKLRKDTPCYGWNGKQELHTVWAVDMLEKRSGRNWTERRYLSFSADPCECPFLYSVMVLQEGSHLGQHWLLVGWEHSEEGQYILHIFMYVVLFQDLYFVGERESILTWPVSILARPLLK